MSETRKLAAILAADVVGYSRLMGEDEAGTARAVRERREAAAPIVRAFGGRLVKTTGDGALLEFPSVVAAVESAILIQKMMAERNAALPEAKRILYRIGVNLGDVLIEGDDILGEGVNVAARLEGTCEPGGVCLSASAHEHVRGRIAAQFADLGELDLKNIARPVRVYARPGAGAREAAARRETARPAPLSLVVLPFLNLAGDAEPDYFADGVTESLTTDLSHMSGAVVIGRNTAFTYKGKTADVREIGRELNVNYALQGSVQRGGGRMRVSVQLIDGLSGVQLWAERFDKPIADLFDMQDEIVARLAGQLGTQLIVAEARRSASKPSPDSMDCYFQGMAGLHRGAKTGELMEETRGFFLRALALDPANIEAMVGLALVDVFVGGNFAPDAGGDRVAAAEALLRQVLSAAPNHALARAWLGRILIGSKRAPEGMAECERALALDRNLATAHAFIGLAKNAVGRAEETEAHVQDALRLSPRDSFAYRWRIIAGFAALSLGRDAEGAEALRRSIEANPNAPVAHVGLAAALALLGRGAEAKSAAAAGMALDPSFSIARFRAGAASDNPVFLARRERIYQGMRLAEIPET